MSDTNTTTTTAGKAPTYIVYHVRDRENKKGVWTRIGAAWSQKDGQGFNVLLDLLPPDGRLSLRLPLEPEA